MTQKKRHLRTIAQSGRSKSSQLKQVSTIGKTVKQQYLLHMSSQYGELRPTNVWDRLASLEQRAPQQISTGFAPWLRHCTDVTQRRSIKLCTMFGGRLG